MHIEGKPVEASSTAAARDAGVGFVTDDRHEEGLFLTLKLRENIGIGALDRISTAGVIDRKRDHALTKDVMSRLGVYTGYRVKDDDDTRASELSGGNQQKVLIGREIAGEPKVILIDEPTKGVDVGAKRQIYGIIEEFARQGKAILLISSVFEAMHMEVIEELLELNADVVFALIAFTALARTFGTARAHMPAWHAH